MPPRKINNDLLVETSTMVKLMNERLFGDGSADSGSLARLYTLIEKHNDAALENLRNHAAQDVVDFRSVNKAVSKVEKKVVWYGGGIAVLGAIGMVLLGALATHFASVAAAAVQAAQSAH
jgi:hypothetical protein